MENILSGNEQDICCIVSQGNYPAYMKLKACIFIESGYCHRANKHLPVSICIHVCIVCIYVCFFVCMYVCIYVCMYVCMCVCIDFCV